MLKHTGYKTKLKSSLSSHPSGDAGQGKGGISRGQGLVTTLRKSSGRKDGVGSTGGKDNLLDPIK